MTQVLGLVLQTLQFPRLPSFQNEGKLCTPKYYFNECYICFSGSILLISQTLKPNRGVPEIFRYPLFHDMISQDFVFSWVARGFSLSLTDKLELCFRRRSTDGRRRRWQWSEEFRQYSVLKVYCHN